MAQLYIGLMSGTSMDGIDCGLVEIDQNRMQLLHGFTHPFPGEIQLRLRELVKNYENAALDELGELDTAIGAYFAEAAQRMLKETEKSPSEIIAIGSHGQTILHRPDNRFAFTLQIGDPNVIASFTEIAVVGDFRRRDIAEGGQGAPLAPGFHQFMFGVPNETRVVVNIGGIANLSVLPAEGQGVVWGFDTGPGNTLLDAWSLSQRNRPMDDFGSWAATGRVDKMLLDRFLTDPYFSRPPPKSTGRTAFGMSWLRKQIDADGRAIPPVDVQTTLVELTARTIADNVRRVEPKPARVLFCGGGWNNDFLMQRLAEMLRDIRVESTEGYGLHPQWVEAAGCAWIAWRRMNGMPANLTSVTGARRQALLGGIYHP